jgi:tripartite-type tricarboxylate transporter receptor subunit TctC
MEFTLPRTRRLRRPYRAALLGLGAACLSALPAWAQTTFPTRPIRMILGFPPGGTSDTLARAMGEQFASTLGQPVVVDNRPGAAGNIAAELAARALADGHTIFLSSGSSTVAPSLYPKLGYDVLRDFLHVTLLAEVPFVLAVYPQLPVRTVQELIAHARARPREVNFASPGIGTPSHLASELLAQSAGIEATHVPYKGSGPALTDLFAGRVHFYFTNVPGALAHLKAGRIRTLAVTGQRRSPSLPDVPTVGESGFKGYRAGSWYGLALPRAAPPAIVNRYYASAQQAMQSADMKTRLGDQGLEIVLGVTPQQMTSFVQQDIKHWAEVIRRAGVTLK